jgi:hypothetical protein
MPSGDDVCPPLQASCAAAYKTMRAYAAYLTLRFDYGGSGDEVCHSEA